MRKQAAIKQFEVGNMSSYQDHQEQDTNDKKSRGRGDPLVIAK